MAGCPNCDRPVSRVFHRIAGVPVNSCLLFTDPVDATDLPRRDIDLAICPRCGFIFNASWEKETTVYGDLYEETQVYSPTYEAFQRRLAEDLIGRYGVVGKEIVEIGCGKGAFLSLLCELGDNSGVGYDPSFVPERSTAGSQSVTFRREYFTENTDQRPVDLVCCRMTLEHISETRRFLQAVRRIASPERGTVVFFQVPDVRRILTEGAFWDIYYEHCSYFSPTSLEHLFRITGFDVLRMSGSYGDQYLTIEARPSEHPDKAHRAVRDGDLHELTRAAAAYPQIAALCAGDWAAHIRAAGRTGARVALWGSGSKAVAFLSAVSVGQQVEYLVDVNPHRWGMFVPGSGKQIVAPGHLSEHPPDLVIAMNPIYRREIAADLERHNCRDALLCALGDTPIAPVPAAAVMAGEAGAGSRGARLPLHAKS